MIISSKLKIKKKVEITQRDYCTKNKMPSKFLLLFLLALSGVVDASRSRRSVAPSPALSPEKKCWLSPWEDHPETCFADLPGATPHSKDLYNWAVASALWYGALALWYGAHVVLVNMGKMQEWVRRSYLRLHRRVREHRRVRFLDDINNNPVEEMSQNDMNNILGEEMSQGEINNIRG